MPSAAESILTMRRAVAQVAMRPTVLLCIKGSLAPHGEALGRWWDWLAETTLGRGLSHWQGGQSPQWRSMADADRRYRLHDYEPLRPDGIFPRWLHFASQADPDRDADATSVFIQDLPPVAGLERVSLIRLRFANQAEPTSFMRLGEASLQMLPLWWGVGGYAFQTVSGSTDTAMRRTAALARRYWCVQLLDLPALQWDAVNGIPGVGWVHWIGPGFAEHRGSHLEDLAAAAAAEASHGVFHKHTPRGLAVVAGSSPHKGDINVADSLEPCRGVSRILRPLMLDRLTPMAGPFAEASVLGAWSRRFDAPQDWLECNVGD